MSTKKEVNNKKKKIIIKICIAATILMLILGILAGLLIYKIVTSEKENGNINTLYIEETYNEETNNQIMTVELENQNTENIESQNNISEPQNTNTSTITKPKKVDPTYYIKVNNQVNVVTAYKKDKAGKYTVPVKAMICSIGTATPTSGVYSISDKYTWRLLERKRIWPICMQNSRLNIISLCTISRAKERYTRMVGI